MYAVQPITGERTTAVKHSEQKEEQRRKIKERLITVSISLGAPHGSHRPHSTRMEKPKHMQTDGYTPVVRHRTLPSLAASSLADTDSWLRCSSHCYWPPREGQGQHHLPLSKLFRILQHLHNVQTEVVLTDRRVVL